MKKIYKIPPGKKPEDLTGKRFGRLLVEKLEHYDNIRKVYIWECICECGNKITVRGADLKNGNTQSCGCLQKERFLNGRKPIENTFISTLTQKTRKDNTSGRKGVYWRKEKQGYEALITVNKKHIYLGFSKDFKTACKLRELGEEKYFKPLIEKNNKEK